MVKTKAREDFLIVEELDVTLLKKGGVEVSASAAELNKLDGATVTPEEINLNDMEVQTLTDTGAITAKNGICLLNKAGVIAATLANPTAGTDDFKRLSIRSLTAQAHTVTVTGGFGNGGSGEDVATFSGVIGDGIELMAYNGYWYITGVHQVTVA
jgi:hypothetical protein